MTLSIFALTNLIKLAYQEYKVNNLKTCSISGNALRYDHEVIPQKREVEVDNLDLHINQLIE